MILKIVHYADIQLEIRTSGVNGQRLEEFRDGLSKIEKVISDEKPDVIIIAGDIYEHASSNADEVLLFSKHLQKIVNFTTRIIIINGNHDTYSNRTQALIDHGDRRNLTDNIEVVVESLNNSKISYYKHTGIYIDDVFPLSWAVWSQLDKHSLKTTKPAYSPWVDNEVPKTNFIELYHDPVIGARDFSGQPSEHFKEYGISLANFRANTVIAGDIHAPSIDWFGENSDKLFTYSSSLIQRSFGEGDYYSNAERIVSGNRQHGYNVIEYCTDTDHALSCKFMSLKNIISRHTFRLNSKFNYATDIPALQIADTEHNLIRLICHGNLNAFLEHENDMIEHFRSKYASCQISTDWAKDVIEQDVDVDMIDDIEKILDKDVILEISKKYINELVNKTSTIDKSDKDDAKEYIYNVFREQLMSTDITSSLTNIHIKSANGSNFMSFDEVFVDFQNTPITVLSGTNGIGKTTLLHLIKWIWYDKVTSFQNDRNKKENYSLLFNDSSEEDEVRGGLVFMLNNELVKVTKVMTRAWKKGKKDIKDENWVELLSGTPSISMKIESTSFTSEDTAECMTWLQNIVTYRELERLLFVNSTSLTNLIQTKTEDLAQEFLSILGLDSLTSLGDLYDTLKDEKLKELVKHTLSISEIQAQKAQSEIVAENLQNQIDGSDNERNVLQLQKSDLDDDLQKLLLSLHKVKTENEYLSDIENHVNEITLNSNDIKDIETKLETLHQLLQNASAETINSKIHVLELSLSDAKNVIDKHESTTTQIETSIELLKESLKTIVSDARQRSAEEINKLKELIATNNTEISESKELQSINMSQYTSEINTIIDKLSDKISELQKGKTDIENSKFDIVTQLSKLVNDNDKLSSEAYRLENEITESENSKVCKECSQNITDSNVLENIKTSILTKQMRIIECRKLIDINDIEITKQKRNRDELIEKINETSARIETFEKLSNSQKEQRDVITDTVKFKKYVDENNRLNDVICTLNVSNAKLQETIQSKSDNLLTTIKASKEFIDKTAEIAETNETLEKHNSSLQQKHESVSELMVEIENRREELKGVVNAQHQISQHNESILTLVSNNKKLQELISITNANIVLAAENVIINNDILIVKKFITEKDAELQQITEYLTKSTNKLEILTKEKLGFDKTIEEIRTWKLAENSLKLYKKLLGKTGLSQYIFAHVIPVINRKLNDTLDNVDFRLQFDQETLCLRFIDLRKNISRPVTFVSGMQETIVGLSLIHIMKLLNNSTRFNILFIDEVSGKLNDGKKLTYEAKDYKKIAKSFIMKLSEHTQVIIIDHVLGFDHARILEVQPSTNGSIIIDVTTT